MPVLLKPLDDPMEQTAGSTPATTPVPAEKTLDPGETIKSSDVVDIMAQIITFSKGVDSAGIPKAEIDPATASLIISAILIYFLIKVAFRMLPWILGIGAVILFAKMGGTA